MGSYTNQTKRRAVRLYLRGRSYRSIAQEIGCSHSTVQSWIESSEVTKRPSDHWPAFFRAKAIREFETRDLSLRATAKSLGISKETLRGWIKNEKQERKKSDI